MAVSMNTSMRADFMISDAAMSKRMTELDMLNAIKGMMFSDVLGGLGGKGSKEPVPEELQAALNELKDNERFEKALRILDRELRVRSADSGESNEGAGTVKSVESKGSVGGKRSGEELKSSEKPVINDVGGDEKTELSELDTDFVSEELIQMVAAMLADEQPTEPKLHSEADGGEELFDPAAAAVNELNGDREAAGRIAAELYQMLGKHGKRSDDEDEAAVTDGFETLDGVKEIASDDLTTDPGITELPQAAKPSETAEPTELTELMQTAEPVKQAESAKPAELAELMKPAVSSEAETVVDSSETVTEQTTLIAEGAYETGSAQTEQITQAAQLDGTPTVQTQTAQTRTAQPVTVKAEGKTETPTENFTAVSDIPTEQTVQQPQASGQPQYGADAQTGQTLTAEANADAQTELIPETADAEITSVTAETKTELPVEAARQNTEPLNGQTKEPTAETGAYAKETGETAASQTTRIKPEEELKEIIEAVTVKEANAPEKTNSAGEARRPQNTERVTDTRSRVKNAEEELEMLKSAKSSKQGEKGFDLTEALNSLRAQSPITLKRADGSEIEVSPSEMIDQVQKMLENIIKENREQSEYSLVLNPEELGRITVKLIKAADGAVSVQIAAENAHTQRVLEQHAELMQNNLRNGGVNLESWQTVSESKQETYAQDYNGSSKNPYFRQENAQGGEDKGDGERSFADIIAAM